MLFNSELEVLVRINLLEKRLKKNSEKKKIKGRRIPDHRNC